MRQVRVPAPQPAPAEAQPERPVPGSGEAGALARRYYALIGAGDYAAAWRLREGGPRAADAEAFAAYFSDFASYEATVGEPSPAAAAGGYDYVEVPVQIVGRTRAGKPFASAGTVTLRRRSGGGDWRVLGR